MHVARLAARLDCQLGGVDLGVGAAQQRQARAAGKELGRAAFVIGDMALRMTQHAAPGRRQRREAERIGGGAGRHQQHVDLALEDVGQLAAHLRRTLVGAVGLRLAVAGRRQRSQDLGLAPAMLSLEKPICGASGEAGVCKAGLRGVIRG